MFHKWILFLLFVIAPQFAEAATLHVGSGQTYSTIQAAVNAANNNDVIVIHAGTYSNQHVEIIRSSRIHLTIQANDSDSVEIQGSSSYADIFYIQNVDLDVKDITFVTGGSTNPPERVFTFTTQTASGADDFTLRVCNSDFIGNSVSGNSVLVCSPAQADSISGWGNTNVGWYIENDYTGTCDPSTVGIWHGTTEGDCPF